MSGVAARLQSVRDRMRRACDSSGRDPRSVRLVAVSKKHALASILEAAEAGQVDFGENYAQELDQKAAEARAASLCWHHIGRVQSSTAKLVAARADWVHGVQDEKGGAALSKHAGALGRTLHVLVAVNFGDEAQKSGVAPSQAAELIATLRKLPALRVQGLMTLPPPALDIAWRHFEALYALREQLGATELPELSMGMSQDMELAIASGSTMVRVGTAIFGERELTGGRRVKTL